jgi:predicted phage tail protein
MLRKIRVYGKLAKFLKQRVFEADVASAAEAVRFLVTNFPQLRPHMAEQYYKVSVGTYALTADELHDPAGQQDIKIVPVLAGAGGNTARILIGVALVAASFFFPAAAGAAPALEIGASTFTSFGAALFGVGVSLTLSGVAGLLTPVPTVSQDQQPDPRKSYSFSGIQNTSRQGIPIPVVYGETVVGSVVVSAGLDTVNT